MAATLLSVIANLLIGLVVLFKTKPRSDKVLFFLLTLSISAWSIANYLSLTSGSAEHTLLWMRVVMLMAVLQVTIFLLFALSYTGKISRVKKYLPLYIIGALIVGMITQTPILFSGVVLDNTVHPTIASPLGIAAFAIFTLGSFLIGIITMLQTLTRAKGITRKSLTLMLGGLFSMFILLIVFNFVLPSLLHIYQFINLGPLFTLPFVYFTAVAIIEFELFDIKIITTRILLYVVSAILLVELFSDTGASEQIQRSIFITTLGLICFYLVKKIESERFLKSKQFYELSQKHRHLRKDHQANMLFISDIAHRLKTPLAIIQFKTDAGQPVNTTVQNEINEVAKTTVATLRNIVQTGKIDAELVQLDRKNIDLSDWLKQQEPEFAALAPQHKIMVETDQPLTTFIDPLFLREALYNLVDNARKFSPAGSPIRIKATTHLQQAVLTVSDTGSGIAKKDLAHIFERHFQAQGTRQQFAGSAGLGLSLVKWVAEAHDGHIEVTSSPKQGTTFSIFLPLAKTTTTSHKTIKQIATES